MGEIKKDVEEMNEAEEIIKEELSDKIKEREAIVAGKAGITQEEEEKYNNYGKVILESRRKLY